MDNSAVEKPDKYWIKIGKPVCHKGWPRQKMYVVWINKELKEIMENEAKGGGVRVDKVFIVNVHTHWLTDQGIFQEGTFIPPNCNHTMNDKHLMLDEKGDVKLTPGGEYFSALLAIKDNQDALKVLFFLYSPSSPFTNQNKKKRIAELEKSKRLSTRVAVILKDKKCREAIEAYRDLNTPVLERWLQSAVDKMEEMMDFWAKTPVSHKNYDKLAESLKGSTGLLELHDKYKKMIADDTQAVSKFRGKTRARLFEIPSDDELNELQ